MKLKLRSLFILIFIVLASNLCIGQIHKHRLDDISFTVDSIEAKEDDYLIRVYGVLKSRPNTSADIISIILVPQNDPTKAAIIASDTDGIDLERYFQWEENGEIQLQIDFPSANPVKLKNDFKQYTLEFVVKDGRKVAVN